MVYQITDGISEHTNGISGHFNGISEYSYGILEHNDGISEKIDGTSVTYSLLLQATYHIFPLLTKAIMFSFMTLETNDKSNSLKKKKCLQYQRVILIFICMK